MATLTPTSSNLSVVNTGSGDFVTTDTTTLSNVFELTSKVYTAIDIDIHYVTDYHTEQLPTANDTVKTASFAVLANPTMKKIVRFTIETLGNQLSLPTPFTSDPNEVLLWTEIVPRNVKTDEVNINAKWRISGEYIYGVIDPTKVKLYAATSPDLTLTLADTTIQTSNFKSGITSPYSPNLNVSIIA